MIVNDEVLGERLGQETLVVCGSPRGMTSLVAFFLYESGYFIGNTLGAKNFEDQEVLKLVPPAEITKAPLVERPGFAELVQNRNETHARWGFKLPHASGHVEALKASLRSPVFVFCVRNPVATARSIVRYEAQHSFTAGRLMDIATRHFAGLVAMCNDSETPSIFIDMEAVKQHPAVFMDELAKALRLPAPTAALRDKISTRGYKTAEPRDGITFKPQ
ncbi:hypothetical protein [Paracoccus sp. (in: a-proteobacteria)]|uniref:hypothetical protein n=1 Tax=Paracoccus sp. TaxID=267 RepID=UPI0035B4E143